MSDFKDEMKQLLKEDAPNKPFNPFDAVNDHMKKGNETITRRDYFAGLILQALIASGVDSDVVRLSVSYADDLLRELKK